MARKTLPLRFRILHVVNKAGETPLTTHEIYEQLKAEYQGEGQFSLDKMEDHLMAVKAVALIEATDPYFDEDGQARYKYKISCTGQARISFLPKEWQI